jgi:glycosyltransferase involved in cell wall biosynthesis
MRIAVFYNLNFGGAKRAVFEQIRELKKYNHKVDVYTTDLSKDIFDPAQAADITYYYRFNPIVLPFFKRLFSDLCTFFLLPQLHKKIAKDIDKNTYDLVLVHPDKLTQAPFLLRFLKTKSAYYCQEPLRIVYEYSLRFQEKVGIIKKIYEELTRLYRKRIDRLNVLSATYTLASCFHIRERMIEVYDVFPKISYLGVDEKTFKPEKVKKKNQVFFVGGKDVWNDGYDLAKKAVELIPKKIRPELLVVSWRKENGERLSEKDLVKIYNQSIVTLTLSRFETFGLVPLESMACGITVIATNVSGHRETVVDGKVGFLVDFEPVQISDKIVSLIQNKFLQKELSENARKHILKTWSWKKRGKELSDLLINLVKN